MKRYVMVVAVAWLLVFGGLLYAYRFLWQRPEVNPLDLTTMMAVAATVMIGYAYAISEVLKALRWPRWLRGAIGAIGTGLPFGIVALALGTHEFYGYDWPGISGIAIILFQEYRMLTFIAIPLPVACFASAALAFYRAGSSVRPTR